ENEAEEEGSVEPSKTNYTSRKNADETDEEVKREKEVEEETEGEAEEEEEHNPKHFDTFLILKELSDSIPPFVIESDDDNYEKTHYSDSLDLRPEYKYDEYVCRGIRSLMALKSKRKNKGEVTAWMEFGGNTHDLGLFGEETDEITTCTKKYCSESVETASQA
nr:hypothetical protein [Tanacetum cinerariifolium]